MRTGAVLLLSLSLMGCATAFRGSKDTIRLDSTPRGAQATANSQALGVTPTEVEVDRTHSTEVTLTKPGYETTTIVPKRHINAGWLTLDILTCVFPVALCIPLLVDALTGRWYNVADYHASMRPGTPLPAGSASTPVAAAVPPPRPSGPPPEMSESERKATARAAYLEGVKLQDAGACPEALPRFEAAQKFFSAPTHLLHLAQCQAATGKLVEASETYETLVRTAMTKDAPEPFRMAQDDAKKELAALRPRIPTLRVQTVPAAPGLTSLVVKINGNPTPNEVLGIARPVNPGKYHVQVWAAGYREASADVDVAEATTRNVDLKLVK